MKKKLSALYVRLSPPGYRNRGEIPLFILWLITALMISHARFFRSLSSALSRVDFQKAVGQTAKLDYFANVLGFPYKNDALSPIPVVALMCLLFIIPRVVYHYTGSRSIYTVRRLPHARRELWRRCVLFPLLLCAIVLAATLISFFFYYAVYVLRCPEGAMQEGQFAYFVSLWEGETYHAWTLNERSLLFRWFAPRTTDKQTIFSSFTFR